MNDFFCDTLKWYELNYTLQAQGGEEYLIIGVFTPMPIIQITNYDGQFFTNHEVTPYYYIDDVSLVELDYNSLLKNKIPNVFTPNGDGVNDYFSLNDTSIQCKNLSIFNRWGNVVYNSSENFKWDGKDKNKECASGVYYYKIEVTDKIILNGFIQLIR